MLSSFRYLTDADMPPVTLAEAKAHLVVEHDLDDELIRAQVLAATRAVERYTRTTLVARTARMEFEGFPAGGCPLELKGGPVTGVTLVGWGDPVTELTAGTDYTLWLAHHPPLVCAGADGWPADYTGRAVVEYAVGAAAAAVPEAVKAAVKLCVAHLYFHRGDAARFSAEKIPPAARHLLDLESDGSYP